MWLNGEHIANLNAQIFVVGVKWALAASSA